MATEARGMLPEMEFFSDFLAEDVEILVDRWGIPHIRAESLRDLFFAQGFNAARDRLWQIDLWRKRGLGLLARDFGPGYLAQDEAARLFLYRGDMEQEWRSYADNARDLCTWFVSGINAFVELTRSHPDMLPREFRTMGTLPALWSPEDVVRIRSHSLSRNALSEIVRSNVMAKADAEVDALRSRVEPPLPDGLALLEPKVGAVPLAAFQMITLASAPVTFSPERLAAPLDEADRWRGAAVPAIGNDDDAEGSNNWAVAGWRSRTGRPILASDPHRDYSLPSIRYIVHLTAPGFDAMGAGEAAVPGISIGHNSDIAFAVTIFGADQEDVFVYELSPQDPSLYRHGDAWERIEDISETFEVSGHRPQTRDLKFTRHGPVVLHDEAAGILVAVRTVWSEPGTAPYLASLTSMFASNLDEFRAAMRRWGTPSVNQVYADTQGNIAWLPVGLMPKRPNWSGLSPVSGDGRYEWAGFFAQGELPFLVNPPEGYVASANEMNLPEEWLHANRPMGFEWLEPSRASRIREVLAGTQEHDITSLRALQTDTLSIPARRLGAIFRSLSTENAAASDALVLLAGWNCRMEADSAGALLFDSWWTNHLKPALIARRAPKAMIQLVSPGDNENLLRLLENPPPWLGGTAGRDELVLATLAAAFEDCAARFGDIRDWRWGALHHAHFQHALTASGREGAKGWDVGPIAAPGSGSTVMLANYAPQDYRVTVGASVRLIMDVGDWDNSCCINTPGQAGDQDSPNYRDMAVDWASGRYVPMIFSAEKVKEAARRRIVIRASPGVPDRPSTGAT